MQKVKSLHTPLRRAGGVEVYLQLLTVEGGERPAVPPSKWHPVPVE